ncbi:MAG TPA: hypothetical protein VG871_12760 [Vicinamibacterales bacterium]|nr:hypothetical protein [Vicinamibacterales bacterium]
MTPDFDDHLRALFDEAGSALPAEPFATRVRAALDARRRRMRILHGAGVLIALAIVWLLAPELVRREAVPAGFARAALVLGEESTRALADSSLAGVLGVYGAAFAIYGLVRTLRWSRIRWA